MPRGHVALDSTTENAMNTRLAQWNANVERHEQAHSFRDACSYLLAGGGRTSDAIAYAKAAHAGDRIIKALEGTTGGASGSWGSEIAQMSVSYIASLAAYGGIYDFALSSMVPAPLNARIVLISAIAQGGEHTESALKVIEEMSSANGNAIDQKVAYAHVILSQELVRLAGAGRALVDRALRQSVIASTDQIYLDGLIAAAPAPTPSTGDFLVDVSVLLEALDLRQGSKVIIVASPTLVKRLSMLRTSGGLKALPGVGIAGGEIAPGVVVRPSDRLAGALEGTVVAFDASQIAAAGGILVPSSGNSPAVALNTGSPSALTDIWGRNLLALKIERVFGFEPVNSQAVAVINSAQYDQTGS
jgi:hypothetical protein